MMKKTVAILMLLCAALFALPVGAMALGDLVLGSATNGQFLHPTLSETDNAAYLIVTGSKILTTPTGEWQPEFSDEFNASNPNGFRLYNAAGKSAEEILDLIKAFKFDTPENAHIELTNTNPGRIYFNPTNRHYYRYVHGVDTEKFKKENGAYLTDDNGEYIKNPDHMKGPSWSEALSAAANEVRFYRTGYLANITSVLENTFVVNMMSKEDDHIDRTIENVDDTTNEEKLKSVWLGGTRLIRSDNGTTTAGTRWYWAAGPEQGQVFYEGKIYDETKQKSDTTGDDQVKGFAYWNNPAIFPGVGEGQVGRADAFEPNNNSSSTEKPDTEVVLMLYHQDTTSVKDDRWNDLPDYRNTTVTGYLIEYGNDRGTDGGDSVENGVPLELITNGGSYVTGYTPPGNVKNNMGVYLPDNTQITRVGYTLDGWCDNQELTGTVYTQIAPHEVTDTETYYAKWTPNTYSITYDLNTDDTTANNPNSAKVSYTVEDEDYTLLPATRDGYTANWYDAATGGNQVTKIDTSAAKDYVLYAQWTPNTNTKYKVNYYRQKLDCSGYDLQTSELSGTTDSTVSIGDWQTAGAQTGFELDTTQGTTADVTINGNGNTVIDIYYNRKVYNITYKNVGDFGTAPSETSFVYGNAVKLEDPTDKDSDDGVTFRGWYTAETYKENEEITEIPATAAADQTVYARWEREVSIKIDWDDANNQDGIRPAEVTVTLSDGTEVELNGEKGWTATVNDLPVYENGTEIAYSWTVDETKLPEGYALKAGPVVSGTTTTFTYEHTPATTTVSGKVVWDDANNQDGKRPTDPSTTFTIQLMKQVDDAYVPVKGENDADVTTTATYDSASQTWKFSFTGLPVNADQGTAIVYCVDMVDTTVTTGYEDNGPQGKNADSSYDITLEHVPLTFDLTVKVQWVDSDNKIRPNSLSSAVKIGDEQQAAVSLAATDNWEATVAELPVYANGTPITYTVMNPGKVTGYAPEASGIQNASVTAEEGVNKEVEFTYTLKSRQFIVNTRGAEVTLSDNGFAVDTANQKYIDTFMYGEAVPAAPDVTNDNGSYGFGGWYTDAAYTTEYAAPTDLSEENVEIFAKWTRTVNVTAEWDDRQNADNQRPADIEIWVKPDSSADLSVDLSSPHWMLNSLNPDQLNLPYVMSPFEGLTVHDNSGNVINYVPEVDLTKQPAGASYSVDSTKSGGDMEQGYTVVLKRDVAMLQNDGKMPIQLVWDDADNQDGKRPESVVVQLYKTVDQVTSSKDGYSHEFTGNETEWTFEDLVANELGKEITYTLGVTSALPDGYSATAAGNKVTIHYAPETLTAEVTVAFSRSFADDVMLPKKIDVTINGTEKKVETGSDPTTTEIATGLAKYAGGVLVEYTLTAPDPSLDDGFAREIKTAVLKGNADEENGTLTYEITLTPKKYDYTLDPNGGKLPEGVSDKGEYTYGAGDELPVIPTRDGNDFAGWEYTMIVPDPTFGDPDRITKKTGIIEEDADGKYKLPTDLEPGSITLTAKWKPQAYKLTFVTRIENPVDQPIVDIPYGYDDKDENITLPTPKASEGWTFAGWYTDAELKTKYEKPIFYKKTYPTATTTTFYARWTKSMSATAVWDDKNNQDGLRKDVNIVLYLYETDPENLGDQVKQDTGMKFTLKTTDNGEVTHTFTGINVHDKDGKEITYIIMPDMTPLTDEKGFSEYTIRTWRPGEEEKEVPDLRNSNYFRLERNTYTKVYSVKIVWNDRNNKYGSRPEKLGIELVADGPFTEPPTTALEQDLSAANGWAHEWVAQVNPTIKLKPVVPLTYDVKIIDEVSPEYVISETNDPDNREKIFTLTLRDLLLPPTGDQSDLALWGGALTLSAAALGWLALRKKSRKA